MFFWENVRKQVFPHPFANLKTFSILTFFIFFLDPNHLHKLLGGFCGPDFRFLSHMAGKSIFWCVKSLKNAVLGKSKGNPYLDWIKSWTYVQNFFDFLTSKNAFSAKVPITKVVQNDEIYKKDYGVKNI